MQHRNWTFIFSCISWISFILVCFLLCHGGLYRNVWTGLLCVPIGLLAFAAMDISSLRPAPTFLLQQLLFQYLIVYILGRLGIRSFTNFAKKCDKVQKSQRAVLAEILQLKKSTKYGMDHNFDEIQSVEDYRRNHPLTDYDYYQKYIDRIKEGQVNIISSEPVIYFGRTSGTSGTSKHFPLSAHAAKILLRRAGLLYCNMYYRIHKGRMDRCANVIYRPKIQYSNKGIRIGPISALYKGSSEALNFTPAPAVAFTLTDECAALYVQAVFYLADPYIGSFNAVFSTIMYSFFKTIEQYWTAMCESIETGILHLPSSIHVDRTVEDKLNRSLVANPERAAELRVEFLKGMQSIGPRIWPRMYTIAAINTGGFSTHGKLLNDIYAPGVAQISQMHAATEGNLGYWTKTRPSNQPQAYTPSVNLIFFEFIHVSECANKDNPPTHLMHELELGESYEMVLTTTTGLFRYRLGDIIKVVDFFHQAPVYEFQYRIGQVLNLQSEKVSENVFCAALEKCIECLGCTTLIDYTTCENIHYEIATGLSSCKKYYVLFVEVQGSNGVHSDRLTQQFDSYLMAEHEEYCQMRDSGIADPLLVVPIKAEGFYKLKMHMIKDTSNMQFKMPRVLRNVDLLRVLLQEQVNS